MACAMILPKPIRVAGGGLAGLTLGTVLRRQGAPVTVFEAGRYPRHKVCGEFISGRGVDMLRGLGLESRLVSAGARWARRVAFYTAGCHPVRQALPRPALCISRHQLDQLLAHEFTSAGGDLRTGVRLDEDHPAGVVVATGRRRQTVVGDWRWFGLKAHATNVTLEADLEMHCFANGYVGLCRFEDHVNVCGLFRRRAVYPEPMGDWRQQLRGPAGSILAQRLGHAVFIDSTFCSVAGLSLVPQCEAPGPECAVGDALFYTPPATGNGMSLAFESGALAAEFLVPYTRGEVTWESARSRLAEECDRRFGSRLRRAHHLHRILFSPPLRHWTFRLAGSCAPLGRLFFNLTR
jgi:flavin-dependent dehydrogenase